MISQNNLYFKKRKKTSRDFFLYPQKYWKPFKRDISFNPQNRRSYKTFRNLEVYVKVFSYFMKMKEYGDFEPTSYKYRQKRCLNFYRCEVEQDNVYGYLIVDI